MRKLLFLLFLAVISIGITAKNGFQGTLLDNNGQPLKGIRINLLGTFNYKKTNSNGIFKFKKIFQEDTLMIFINEKEVVKIPVSSLGSPIITLDKKYASCTVGNDTITYLYQPAPDVTFNNNVITQRQIRERAPRDLIELLRGNVAGLRIYEDGGTSKASLRASSSFELSTEPLFIIDHSEYESLESANNSISIEDIEEVKIIKDGGGYGMKGANGVILITTRRH